MFSVKVVKLVFEEKFSYSLDLCIVNLLIDDCMANVLKSFKDARYNLCTVLKSVLQRSMLPIKLRLIYSEARRSIQILGIAFKTGKSY